MAGHKGFSRGFGRTSAAFTLLALTACGTAPNTPSGSGAIDTGTYPNLNIKPGVANQQLTPDQTARKSGELRAAQQLNAARRENPANDVAVLRRIGDTHAGEALQEIENP